MVSVSTFDWSSLRNLTVVPRGEAIVMLATVATTVLTHNLAQGVLVGVLLSTLFFARKVSQLSSVTSTLSDDGQTRTYTVSGQLFFVSTQGFIDSFELQEEVNRVVIDLSSAHIWDGSAIAALDKVAMKLMRRGVTVELVGQNEASAALIARLAQHDKPGTLLSSPAH